MVDLARQEWMLGFFFGGEGRRQKAVQQSTPVGESVASGKKVLYY